VIYLGFDRLARRLNPNGSSRLEHQEDIDEDNFEDDDKIDAKSPDPVRPK